MDDVEIGKLKSDSVDEQEDSKYRDWNLEIQARCEWQDMAVIGPWKKQIYVLKPSVQEEDSKPVSFVQLINIEVGWELISVFNWHGYLCVETQSILSEEVVHIPGSGERKLDFCSWNASTRTAQLIYTLNIQSHKTIPTKNCILAASFLHDTVVYKCK